MARPWATLNCSSSHGQLLANFDLNIPSAAYGVSQINVIFDIDENSILIVSGVETGVDQGNTTSITNDKGRLIYEDLAMIMILVAEKSIDVVIAIRHHHGCGLARLL